MKSKMRPAPVVASVLMILAAVFVTAADTRSVPSGDFTVHEWGTFTSVAGPDGSAVDWDALGCQDDLPAFVNDFGYRGFKWRLTGTVRMETPVIYFYSPLEVDAHVKVVFPRGLITEWYPRAEYEVRQSSRSDGSAVKLAPNLNGIDTSLRTLSGAIEWRHVRVEPHAAHTLPLESGPSRYYAARDTDAASLTVEGQHEKFLFYRGVGRFPVPLAARVSPDGTVRVENRGDATVPLVMYFENRAGRLGYRTAGFVKETVTLDPPRLDSSFSRLRHDLETALVEQGLFPKEASAMVETWKDSWFEEGARLIYLVPARSIDATLPLAITPAPSQTTRVFVGRIELVTPEIIRSVEQAISGNDTATLNRHGRFLGPILQRIESGSPRDVNQIRQLRKAMEARRCGS